MAKSACKLRANRIIDQERSETPREWTFTLPPPPPPLPQGTLHHLAGTTEANLITLKDKSQTVAAFAQLFWLCHTCSTNFSTTEKVFTPTSETLCSNNLNNPYNKLFGNVGNKKKKKCMEIVNICNFINI